MCSSRLCIVFLVSFIISVNLGSVSGGGEFNLGAAKVKVKGLLYYLYGLLGETSLSTTSIDKATSLSDLTTAADDFISQGEINSLKKLAYLPYNSDGMSTAFSNFRYEFQQLLNQDPYTANESIPLSGDMDAISAVWEQ